MAVRHENRSGMAAFALDHNAQAGRRRDGRDGADFKLLLLKDRPLLDMQLGERRIIAGSFTAERGPVKCAAALA